MHAFSRKYDVILLGTLLMMSLSINGWADENIQCPSSGKVCRLVSTSLPLRALPRTFSTMYSEPDTASKVISSNVKAFRPLYVFEKKDVDFSEPAHPKGWYQVGTKVKKPQGWMQTKDVFEWKHAIVVSFTPLGKCDERHHPVLMFKTKDALKDLVESDDRVARTQAIYAGLNATAPDEVISVEPARFVSIEEKFYLLPVINFERVDLFPQKTQYLQIASAIPGSRADEANPDTVKNPSFLAQGTPPRDITVWVMDRDLLDPNIRALDVRILLTKRDFRNLILSLNMLHHQMKWTIVSPDAFFTGLRGLVAIAAQDQNITLEFARRLADAELLESWIDSLPYKSQILEMRDDQFKSLSFGERANLMKDIESKLELYWKIYGNSDLWVALDELDTSDDHVYPLPLTALP